MIAWPYGIITIILMKQNLNFDANQTNILNIWEVQTERLNHLRRLNTIYRDKSHTYKNHAFQEHENRNYMALHLKNKEKDMERRQKSLQHHIDYENQILRNKLIDASLPKHKPKMPSLYEKASEVESSSGKEEKSIGQSRKKQNYKSESYFKKQEKNKILEENAKLFVKLSAMKSDIMEKLNIKNHQKKLEEMKDKLEKRSPKKMKMLRSFFKKRNLEYGQPSFQAESKVESRHAESVENQQELN